MDEDKNVVLDLSLPKKDVNNTESHSQGDTDVYCPSRTFVGTRLQLKTDDVTVTNGYEGFEGRLSEIDENDTSPPCSKRQRYMEGSSRASDCLQESNTSHVQENVTLANKCSDLDLDVGKGAICKTIDGVTMYLHDETLWHAFSNCGTEMIISRGGRRMFPHIVLSLEGLVPENVYSITLEILPADDRRYKYINNQWMAMGMADPGPGAQPVTHPDSPNTGSYWKLNRVSFSKVRLTNNKEASKSDSSDGNILLLSMHKYVAVIKVRDETVPGNQPLVFCFDETRFMAVTAYQNYKITHLKIKNNPFAKAFRDIHNSSSNRTTSKRKDSPTKYHSNSSRDGVSSRALPTTPPQPAPSFSPLYFPFPSAAIRPYRFDLPGVGPFNTTGAMHPSVLPRMNYFPWMAIGERMNSMWLKNHQRLFDLSSQVDVKTLTTGTKNDVGDSSTASPFTFLDACRQSVPTKAEDSTRQADYPSASN